jgi:Protein of unknown function (DUF3019)
MRTRLTLLFASCFTALQAVGAEPPVRLNVKPLLCVLDKNATSCAVTFDIRWKSELAGEYCLKDEALPAPLRCWPSALSGEHRHERLVTQDFFFWLSPPAGNERVAEAKIEVLRVGSTDRRRERRSRHVWDVL